MNVLFFLLFTEQEDSVFFFFTGFQQGSITVVKNHDISKTFPFIKPNALFLFAIICTCKHKVHKVQNKVQKNTRMKNILFISFVNVLSHCPLHSTCTLSLFIYLFNKVFKIR